MQFFQTSNRVDRGADFHQRAQVARHQVKRIVESDLNSRAANNVLVLELNLGGFRRHIAFMQEEEKPRIANSDAVPVLQYSLLDRHVVYEGPVKALQVADPELVAVFLDLRMAPGYRRVREAEGSGGFAADHHWVLSNGKNAAL